MSNLNYARSKLAMTREAVNAVRKDDFPYTDSRAALEAIDTVLKDLETRLQSISMSSNTKLVFALCEEVTKTISINMHFLGFVRRSTNIRNAFEFYGPILLLSRQILNKDIKLVIASEWMFSPFTYPRIYDHLADFLFIGLPASESSNSLILPLCGHEIGHHVWRDYSMVKQLFSNVKSLSIKSIESNWGKFSKLFPDITKASLSTDMFAIIKLKKIIEQALRQCEEVFCDFVGLKIFGESYLYAFQYILAPSLGVKRSPFYPSNVDRVSYLEVAAAHFNIHFPEGFSSNFNNDPDRGQSSDIFILRMSDAVVKQLCQNLVEEVKKVANLKAIITPGQTRTREVYDELALAIPPRCEISIGELINGLWMAYHDSSLWKNDEALLERKFEILNEIAIKSLEVIEARELQSRS